MANDVSGASNPTVHVRSRAFLWSALDSPTTPGNSQTRRAVLRDAAGWFGTAHPQSRPFSSCCIPHLHLFRSTLLHITLHVTCSSYVLMYISPNTRCSILARVLLPWPPVHEMGEMKMFSTSTVCVCKRDNCRNRSPGEFGKQKWVHRTKRVKIMEVEQRYVIRFFSNEGMPGVQIVERLRQHYGEDALSRTQRSPHPCGHRALQLVGRQCSGIDGRPAPLDRPLRECGIRDGSTVELRTNAEEPRLCIKTQDARQLPWHDPLAELKADLSERVGVQTGRIRLDFVGGRCSMRQYSLRTGS
jgi:hypothetical protein